MRCSRTMTVGGRDPRHRPAAVRARLDRTRHDGSAQGGFPAIALCDCVSGTLAAFRRDGWSRSREPRSTSTARRHCSSAYDDAAAATATSESRRQFLMECQASFATPFVMTTSTAGARARHPSIVSGHPRRAARNYPDSDGGTIIDSRRERTVTWTVHVADSRLRRRVGSEAKRRMASHWGRDIAEGTMTVHARTETGAAPVGSC